ncbi:MAG: hypothetical protein ACYS8W_07930 [Planctomycetota bacterium]|jgi:hypothetical protein
MRSCNQYPSRKRLLNIVISRKDRGSMLIVALGVLTLLSILAVAFASLMMIEKEASRNYMAGLRAQLLCEAAIARTLAELSDPAMTGPTDLTKDSYPYRDEEGDPAHGSKIEESKNYSYKGEVSYGTYLEGGDNYRVKVLDTASQINLNQDLETMPQVFESLGYALAAKFSTDNPVRNLSFTFTDAMGQEQTVQGGDAIIAYRSTLRNQQFTSKSQLRDLYDQNDDSASYDVIRDFVTAHSWLDRQSAKGSYSDVPQSVVTYTKEPRYPLNINTAPLPVLYSLLTPVAARFKYIYTDTGDRIVPVDQDDDLYPQHSPVNEELKLLVEPIWVYIPRLGNPMGNYDASSPAGKIATLIAEYRKTNPFRCQADVFKFFLSTTKVGDTVLPDIRQIKVDISQKLRDSGKTEDQVKNELIDDEAFLRYYKRAVRSMLISNFNPNVLPNSFNPNVFAFHPVDKGGLWFRDTDGIKKAAHTLEFCFSPMGYFEVISLGRIEAPETSRAGVSADRRIVVAERKLRTVVRAYDAVRHTAQEEFETVEPELADAIDQIHTYPQPLQIPSGDPMAPPNKGDEDLGYLEIEPETQPVANGVIFHAPFDNDFNADIGAFQDLDDKYFSSTDSPYKDSLGGTAAAEKTIPKAGPLDTKNHDLFRDGFNVYQGRQSVPKVAAYRAASPDQREPSAISASDPTNIASPQGSISFWMKPEFDADARVFCGFFSVTTATRMVIIQGGQAKTFDRNQMGSPAGQLKCTGRQSNPDGFGYRGVQMFMFKNTEGTLRVVRMHYQAAFGAGDDYWVIDTDRTDPTDPDKVRTLPRRIQHAYFPPYTTDRHPQAIQPGDEEWWPENYEKDPQPPEDPHGPWREVPDEKKVFENMSPYYGRVDLTVNLGDKNYAGWLAHEWHHVCISWDDTNDNRLLRLFIDGKRIVTHRSLGERGRPLLLNERMPRDVLQVGGIYRWRYNQEKGIFKWGSSWAKSSANATISDFRAYDVAIKNIPQPPSKYNRSVGEYFNRIRVPFPVGVTKMRLGSISWTSYPAPDDAGQFMTPKGLKNLQNGKVEVEVAGRAIPENGQPFPDEVWVDATSPYVDYMVRMSAYSVQGSPATVVSPVFDDITITFHLPKEEVILTEKMHD